MAKSIFVEESRMTMKLAMNAVFFCISAMSLAQGNNSAEFVGTAINSTNPEAPVAAPVQLSIGKGFCKLNLSAPLIGSGMCVAKYDRSAKRLEFTSFGPPKIIWIGEVKGNLVSGSFSIESSNQTGSFYLAMVDKSKEEAQSSGVAPATPPITTYRARSSCVPAIESTVSGDLEGWSGETLFKLDNGQIWEQAEYDYTYFYDYRPDVTIYQTSEGCRMKVDGEDETVLVKRIK